MVKDKVGERVDVKEVEEEGKELVVWWKDDLAVVVEGKGDWSRDRIRGMGGVEKGVSDRIFRVGRTSVRSGDGYGRSGRGWVGI